MQNIYERQALQLLGHVLHEAVPPVKVKYLPTGHSQFYAAFKPEGTVTHVRQLL